MNPTPIDFGLCAGLACVLVASLAVFFMLKVEIATLRQALQHESGRTQSLLLEMQAQRRASIETPSNTAPGRTPAAAASKLSRPALPMDLASIYLHAVHRGEPDSASGSREDHLAALRRAWASPAQAETKGLA